MQDFTRTAQIQTISRGESQLHNSRLRFRLRERFGGFQRNPPKESFGPSGRATTHHLPRSRRSSISTRDRPLLGKEGKKEFCIYRARSLFVRLIPLNDSGTHTTRTGGRVPFHRDAGGVWSEIKELCAMRNTSPSAFGGDPSL